MGVLLVTAVAGGLALTGRPEIWSAGAGFAGESVLALAGTSVGAVTLLAALAGGVVLRMRCDDDGSLSALATLGHGRRRLLLATTPMLLLTAALSALIAFVVEPAAWSTVHRVKGSPAATAIALGRLDAGEVVTLPGGAVVSDKEGLAVAWGETRAALASARPEGAGWRFEDVDVSGPTAEWTAGRIELVPVTSPAPPSSPWTFGWERGLVALGESGPSGRRGRLVFHRRFASIVLAPLLAVLGFTLAGRRRGDGSTRLVLRPLLVALGLFLIARALDSAALAGNAPSTAAAWLPTVLVAGFLALGARR